MPCIATALLFIVWDVLFTAHGVWSFNPRYLVGIFLLGLPLEEYLFFLCIPYACVFTYYVMVHSIRMPQMSRSILDLTWVMAGLLFMVGMVFAARLYTSVTFLLLGSILSLLAYRRAHFLPSFYISFLVILIPFYLSNGVLTGAVTDEPVVIYNNDFNLRIRMVTIPIEDVFYGMAMLLLNVTGFEYLRGRRAVLSTTQ